MYFLLHWVFVAAHGLSLVAVSRASLQLQYQGFSLWRLTSCQVWALQCRLSSCDTWTQLPRSMWDLSRPGIEPLCPAIAGGFLTTGPPGKSLSLVFHASVPLFKLCPLLRVCMPGKFQVFFHISTLQGSSPCPKLHILTIPPSHSHQLPSVQLPSRAPVCDYTICHIITCRSGSPTQAGTTPCLSH